MTQSILTDGEAATNADLYQQPCLATGLTYQCLSCFWTQLHLLMADDSWECYLKACRTACIYVLIVFILIVAIIV